MPKQILLIGYGNPGRLDDGLGPLLADEIEKMNLPDVKVDSNYQLTVEDSAEVAKYEAVIFVDASVDCVEPFYFEEISPVSEISFTTHSIAPAGVLGLANELFGSVAKGYILGIRGYEFNEFGERLSDKAKSNLAEAVQYIKKRIVNNEI